MITVTKLSKRFGLRWVFKDVSFEAKKGEVVLICGENGCGKTTLLKILAELTSPSSGSIIKKGIKKIGYVGHESPFFEDLSLEENLNFWFKINKIRVDSATVKEYLKSVRLLKFKNQKLKHFSLGMIKRADILRVFLTDPDLFLLDEPTSGTDVNFLEFFASLIEKAKRRKKIILWVSHDKQKHISFADKLLEFKENTSVLRCLK